MLEVLNNQEMSEVKGGASDSYCDLIMGDANGADNWSDAQWDAWADNYETMCL